VIQYFCNGEQASGEVLAAAQVNYGHFTSLQVRDGAVQGWALHLQRLQQGTQALFGVDLDAGQVQSWVRQALADCSMTDASVRITVFARAFDFRQPLRQVPVDVLVAVAPPASMPAQPRTVLPVHYQRELAHIKHVGTFPLFHHRRQAMAQGHDDALFVDAAGRVSEGTTWNVAFWDGRQVLWPLADILHGVAEQLLENGLKGLGQVQVRQAIPLSALSGFSGAVACNATGLWPLAGVGEGLVFGQSEELLAMLRQALALAPWERL